MNDSHRHGGRVPPLPNNSTLSVILPWPTRFRFLIEELWEELSEANLQHDTARQVLASLHQQARQREENDLAKAGIPGHYFIIRPINPLNPPAPEDMTRMRDAITTLAALGMICGPEGDREEH
jgi:hypothetical protein